VKATSEVKQKHEYCMSVWFNHRQYGLMEWSWDVGISDTKFIKRVGGLGAEVN